MEARRDQIQSFGFFISKDLVLKTQSLQYLCGIGGDVYDEIEIPQAITVQDRGSLFDASVDSDDVRKSRWTSRLHQSLSVVARTADADTLTSVPELPAAFATAAPPIAVVWLLPSGTLS